MRDQGGGAIITVATRAALRGAPGMLAYASAKAGVITFTRSLAMQLAPDNIRVNGIAPGFLITESNVTRPIRPGRRSGAAGCPCGAWARPGRSARWRSISPPTPPRT